MQKKSRSIWATEKEEDKTVATKHRLSYTFLF